MLSPQAEVPQLTKGGMGMAGGKVIVWLTNWLVANTGHSLFWPHFLGFVCLFVFLTSYTVDLDFCSHPQLTPEQNSQQAVQRP